MKKTTCQLSTCIDDAVTKIRGRVGQAEIEVEVCANHSKGLIIGSLREPHKELHVRTFRVVQQGCPVCAFADECQHTYLGHGRYVYDKK
jgi:hypothetical protein